MNCPLPPTVTRLDGRDAFGRVIPGARVSIATEFQPGERRNPPTEIKPGQRLSPRTEFKPGQAAHNKLPLGSITVRRETHTESLRAWVKVAEPNVWKKRAVIVWEEINGPLPRGYVVHHRDRDTLNDDPSNLELKSRREHLTEHRSEVLSARRERGAM